MTHRARRTARRGSRVGGRPAFAACAAFGAFAAFAVALLVGAAPASAQSAAPAPPMACAARGSVVPGVEVLLRDSLTLLRGKRVGLITNHSGRDRCGTSTVDLLARAPGVKLVALFGPEHGIRGTADERVANSVDSATGLPVYSLFGATRAPSPEMLRDVDVLVYDIQDVGARVYTFVWTMALAAEAAGKAGKRFVVLDRPDPIRGDRVDGNVLEPQWRSFVGQYPVALRYGLTPGELLRWLVGTRQIAVDFSVVPMDGWRRSMWYDETGLPWVNPSPNMKLLSAAALYPGIVFFEGTNVSEGRGTEAPFHLVGAPWLGDAGAIAAELNALALPGVRFDSTTRTIDRTAGKFPGKTIPMVRITLTDRDAVRPVAVGIQLMRAIYARHAADWKWAGAGTSLRRLAGTERVKAAVEQGTVDALLRDFDDGTRRFEAESRAYRLYP